MGVSGFFLRKEQSMKAWFPRAAYLMVLSLVLGPAASAAAAVNELVISHVTQEENEAVVSFEAFREDGTASQDELSQGGIQVWLNGEGYVPLEISRERETDDGIAYTFCVDIPTSASDAEAQEIRDNVSWMIQNMGPNDMGKVMAVGDGVRIECDFTQDKEFLNTAVSLIGKTQSASFLYEGLEDALDAYAADFLPKNGAVVVFSDGADQSGESFEAVLESAARRRVPVYIAGLRGADRFEELGQLAAATGGRIYTYNAMTITKEAYTIREVIRSAYKLRIAPKEDCFGREDLTWVVRYSGPEGVLESQSYAFPLAKAGEETEGAEDAPDSGEAEGEPAPALEEGGAGETEGQEDQGKDAGEDTQESEDKQGDDQDQEEDRDKDRDKEKDQDQDSFDFVQFVKDNSLLAAGVLLLAVAVVLFLISNRKRKKKNHHTSLPVHPQAGRQDGFEPTARPETPAAPVPSFSDNPFYVTGHDTVDTPVRAGGQDVTAGVMWSAPGAMRPAGEGFSNFYTPDDDDGGQTVIGGIYGGLPRIEFRILFNEKTGSVTKNLQSRLTLGRGSSPDVDVTLGDPSPDSKKTSRNHASLYKRGNEIFIKDEGSVNGTVVNGVRIQSETALKNHDVLQLGMAQVTIEIYNI